MVEAKAAIKIHTIEVIDTAGRRLPQSGGADLIYLSQSSTQADDAVTVSPYPPADPALRWQVQVLAHNRRCQIINLTRDAEVRISLGAAESNDWTTLKPHQTLTVDYEHPVWINQKVGLVFYRRVRGNSIEVELWPDDGTELTERHTRAVDKDSQAAPQKKVDTPLKWAVRLRHHRQIETVQFHLELDVGRLPRSAYRLDTLHPKLNLVDHQYVALVFFQSLDQPVETGDYLVGVTATADEYPDEIAQDFQILRVTPFYAHQLRFENDSTYAPHNTTA